MKEFTPSEPNGFARAGVKAVPRFFRVLVAVGDETDRLLTVWHLGKAWPVERNMIVECAADGAQALERIRRNRFALIVLDWSLPRRDSAIVLRAIREHCLRIPIVVVSGRRPDTMASALKSMAAAFVNRDELDPSSLHNAIATSMRLQKKRTSAASGLEAPHMRSR